MCDCNQIVQNENGEEKEKKKEEKDSLKDSFLFVECQPAPECLSIV